LQQNQGKMAVKKKGINKTVHLFLLIGERPSCFSIISYLSYQQLAGICSLSVWCQLQFTGNSILLDSTNAYIKTL